MRAVRAVGEKRREKGGVITPAGKLYLHPGIRRREDGRGEEKKGKKKEGGCPPELGPLKREALERATPLSPCKKREKEKNADRGPLQKLISFRFPNHRTTRVPHK